MWRFLLCISILFSGCVFQKKLASSHSKTPNWLHGIEKDHIITFGVGTNHEEAKNLAIARVKEEIIKSVAVQVTYEEELTTEEDVDAFFESFETSTSLSSDYFEPIKGISANNVSDFYWEEFVENGSIKIKYHIKYPFKVSELSALIADYERINAEWNQELASITQKKSYKHVEAIYADLDQLRYLSKKLPNQRSKEALERYRLLEEMASDIEIVVLQNAPGIIRYQLSLYGQPIFTQEKPEIKFTCPIQISSVQDFIDQVQIEYSAENCTTEERHYISVRYRLDGFIARGEFSILFD